MHPQPQTFRVVSLPKGRTSSFGWPLARTEFSYELTVKRGWHSSPSAALRINSAKSSRTVRRVTANPSCSLVCQTTAVLPLRGLRASAHCAPGDSLVGRIWFISSSSEMTGRSSRNVRGRKTRVYAPSCRRKFLPGVGLEPSAQSAQFFDRGEGSHFLRNEHRSYAVWYTHQSA